MSTHNFFTGEEIKPVEPVALQCNFCGEWSKYDKEYNGRLPRGWRDIEEKGYQCNECRLKGGKK